MKKKLRKVKFTQLTNKDSTPICSLSQREINILLLEQQQPKKKKKLKEKDKYRAQIMKKLSTCKEACSLIRYT